MVLSEERARVLGRVIATLAEPHDEAELRVELGSLMLQLLDAQHYASYVWDGGRGRFDKGVRINMDPANLARYDTYFQYHDPITFEMQRHRRAVRVTDVMPQAELKRTEFFNDFLARDGLHWGVNLYAWLGDRNIGDMRIWRDRRHDDFTRDDLALLDLVRPAFVAALARCRDDAPDIDHAADGRGLSAREHQVARLASDGMRDKDIARRLDIAVSTVRTHLDHAFEKLAVRNRVALARRLGR